MGKRQRRPKSTKKRLKKKSSKSKLFKLLEFVLRLVIYPFYVTYVLMKTLLIVKPKETVYSLKEKVSTGYSKSKKYYRKAKKFTLDDQGDETSDDDDEGDKKLGKKKKMKKKKMKFIKKLILKSVLLSKKLFSLVWKLLIKIKYLKKYIVMKIKWSIKKVYELWLDTERIVFKIKGSPFAIIDKVKSFVKVAIEEPDQYDYEIIPKSQSNFPPPIQISEDDGSLDEIIITKTVTEWPDTKGHRPLTTLSSRPISSRGAPQSKFSTRIESTIPSRRLYAPPTNEELIDDYFNTYDAIQPHDGHRNSVARRRKRRVVTDEDVNTIEYVPDQPTSRPIIPERPVSRIVTSRDKNYDDDYDYEERPQKSRIAYNATC